MSEPTPTTPATSPTAARLRRLADALDEVERLLADPARKGRLARHVPGALRAQVDRDVSEVEMRVESVLRVLRPA